MYFSVVTQFYHTVKTLILTPKKLHILVFFKVNLDKLFLHIIAFPIYQLAHHIYKYILYLNPCLYFCYTSIYTYYIYISGQRWRHDLPRNQTSWSDILLLNSRSIKTACNCSVPQVWRWSFHITVKHLKFWNCLCNKMVS